MRVDDLDAAAPLRDLDEKIAAQERLRSIKRQRREQREAEAAASVT